MKVDKKQRSEKRKMKNKESKKKVSKAIEKRLKKYRDSTSFLDQQLSQELDLLKLNFKLLKDAYEKERKLNKYCTGCKKLNLNLELKKVEKKPKKEFLSDNKIHKSADEVELSNPSVVNKEYVECVKIDLVKLELINQVKVKDEPTE